MIKETENKPLITAIIPTYQRPKLLKRAILSVLNQTYPNFQVCIYDNASGDETAKVVKELARNDSRVKYYCHLKNIEGKNFNFGLRRVNTPYFSFLSDDDILLPNFYKEAMKGFKKYPEAGFVATQTIIATHKEVKGISLEDYEERLYRPPEGLLKMANGGVPAWTSILFKKEVIQKVGLLDLTIGGPSDTDFVFRVCSLLPYVVLKFPGAIYFINELSSSFEISLAEWLDGYKKILEKMKNDKICSSLFKKMPYQDFKNHLGKELLKGGLVDIKKKRFSQAKKISQFLKNDLGENLKAVVINDVIKLCESSNDFYNLFVFLCQMRKRLNIPPRRLNEKKLQDAYKNYLEYLNKDAS